MNICCVTGKKMMYGNNVSHANNKTRRRFDANIQTISLYSSVLGTCTIKVTPNGLKTIETKGGLDKFLETTKKIYGLQGRNLVKKYFEAKRKNLIGK